MTVQKSSTAFRTIGEVALWLGEEQHVLRFWESKFPQIKPVKRAGGRRYYRPEDMLLLGGLKQLLHGDGVSIRNAQEILRTRGTSYVAGLSKPLEEVSDETRTDRQDMLESTAEQPPQSTDHAEPEQVPAVSHSVPEPPVPASPIPASPEAATATVPSAKVAFGSELDLPEDPADDAVVAKQALLSLTTRIGARPSPELTSDIRAVLKKWG